MKRYPIRVLRYFLFLVGLFIVLLGVLLLVGQTSPLGLRHVVETRGWVLLAVFVGLPLVYPFFSYGARSVRGNLHEKRETIDRALASCGFEAVGESPERIVAKATGSKRFTLLTVENRIEITPDGNQHVRIEGPKKEIVRIEARMRAFSNL